MVRRWFLPVQLEALQGKMEGQGAGQGAVGTRRLAETVALMQHHDAITGTDRFHVNQDYRKLLTRGQCYAPGRCALALCMQRNLETTERPNRQDWLRFLIDALKMMLAKLVLSARLLHLFFINFNAHAL